MYHTLINGLQAHDIEIEGVDMSDAPDFCDAFVVRAIINDGVWRDATDEELDEMNEDGDLIQELIINQL